MRQLVRASNEKMVPSISSPKDVLIFTRIPEIQSAVAEEEAVTVEEEGLALVVEDDGPGIAQEDRVKVLERGIKTDETVPGYGLGLAMVRDTVDLYGGKLAVEESLLDGARFSVRLPGKRMGPAPLQS